MNQIILIQSFLICCHTSKKAYALKCVKNWFASISIELICWEGVFVWFGGGGGGIIALPLLVMQITANFFGPPPLHRSGPWSLFFCPWISNSDKKFPWKIIKSPCPWSFSTKFPWTWKYSRKIFWERCSREVSISIKGNTLMGVNYQLTRVSRRKQLYIYSIKYAILMVSQCSFKHFRKWQ